MVSKRTRLHSAVVMATGIGIGVIWFALAVAALWSAADGLANDRTDWALGWGLVGILLLIGAGAAAVGTWWHEKRVLRNE